MDLPKVTQLFRIGIQTVASLLLIKKIESREQGREFRDGNYYLILGGQERPT